MKIFDREFDGVLFDMDGLMLDTERISMKAWQAGCLECGVTLSDAQFLDIIGHREADCIRLVKGMHGEHLDGDAIARATRTHYARLLESGVPVMPGLVDALSAIRGAGLPIAVATSTHHKVAVEKLTKAGVIHFFLEVVGGDMAARGKPAPDLYLKAAEAIGRDPVRCLALEDSGPGLRAAHSAGCSAVLIPDLKPPTPEVSALAWRVLGSMREFADALRL
jgi:HAD superfamily hydrolase (TIGR01509 family)